jgi:hypothetical protein
MELKKDTTEPITFRVDKALKHRLKKKFGKKIAPHVIPHLELISKNTYKA